MDTKTVKELLIAKLNSNSLITLNHKAIDIVSHADLIDEHGMHKLGVRFTMGNYPRIYDEVITVPAKMRKHYAVWTFDPHTLEVFEILHNVLATSFETTLRAMIYCGWKDENGYPLMVWERKPHETECRYLWKGVEMYPSAAVASHYANKLIKQKMMFGVASGVHGLWTPVEPEAKEFKLAPKGCAHKHLNPEVSIKPIYTNPLKCPKCKDSSYEPIDFTKHSGLALDGLEYIKKTCGKTLSKCPECGDIKAFTDDEIAKHKAHSNVTSDLLKAINRITANWRYHTKVMNGLLNHKKVATPVYGIDECRNVVKLTNGEGCSTFEHAIKKDVYPNIKFDDFDVRMVRHAAHPVFETAEAATKYLVELKAREYFNQFIFW